MDYQAPGWLRGAHAQTVWPLFIKGPAVPLQRERWTTPDDDFIHVDHLPARNSKPLVVLFHGLEGSSDSHYARALMRELARRQWNGAVAQFRGCSGEPNLLARAYHSGDADEIDWILRRFADRYPDSPRFAVGISLGGNALLCWLGTHRGEQAASLIRAAAAVSAPLDLAAAGHHLGVGANKLYTWHFLRTLRARAHAKSLRFPGTFNADRATRAHSLHEFDDAYTAPLHGFRDADDYWQRASSKPLLRHIGLPTLVLNACNDPFLPASALPDRTQVAPWVTLEQPLQGGHVGFVTGPFPGKLDWLAHRLLYFFEQQMALAA